MLNAFIRQIIEVLYHMAVAKDPLFFEGALHRGEELIVKIVDF